MGNIYLDHASATPLVDEARAAMQPWLAHTADPARVHSAGREARVAVEAARDQVGGYLGVRPRDVVFTSSGTEALNWVVYAAAGLVPGHPEPWGSKLVVSEAEHSAVLDPARRGAKRAGLDLVEVPVDADGRVVPFDVPEDAALVAVQHVNHETGVIQPVGGIAERCRDAGVRLLVDACQPSGDAIPGADFVVVSSHKLGGPEGIGALGMARRIRIPALFVGGEQELLRRAGGENVAGAVGFGAAVTAPRPNLKALRDRLAAGLEDIDGVCLLGAAALRAPHIVCVTVPGLSGEALLLGLDKAGICANSGSSCSAERLEPSHVLLAMGADADASLRFSLGAGSQESDVDAVLDVLPGLVRDLRELTRQA